MQHRHHPERSNAEIFQELHNQLDALLRAELGKCDSAPHHTLLAEMAERDPFFRKHCDELQRFRALRNALVHDPTSGLGPIAEPHDRVLRAYQEALSYVTQPPIASSVAVPRADFYTAGWDDRLDDVVRVMKDETYSLAPVFEGERMEGVFLDCTLTIAVSAGAFAKALPQRLGDLRPYIDLHGTQLGAIEYLPFHAPLRQVSACFSRAFRERRALRAIFLTTDGSPAGSVTGLVTAYDLLARDEDAASAWPHL